MTDVHVHIFRGNSEAYTIEHNVRILTASDAHIPEHAGANIRELQAILDA